MNLINGRLVVETLKATDTNYSVDGMLGPTFHNEGETAVNINFQKVLPGESYPVEFPNVFLKGQFNISFDKVSGKKNLLLIKYIQFEGLFIDPTTGRPQGENTNGACHN